MLKTKLLSCALCSAVIPLAAQTTVLWDFETEEQYNQFQIATWYPEAAGTNHGSIEWYAFADESGGLAYTLLMDETDPLIGGTGFRWAVVANITSSDPQYAPLLEAYMAGGTLSYDVYTTSDGSADWKQTFVALRGNPGGQQNQWNDLTTMAWPTEGDQTETATVTLSQGQLSGEGVPMPESPESIDIAFAVNGPINPGSTLVFDNIRVSVGGEAEMWLGQFPILENGWADTEGWIGYAYPFDAGWAWSDSFMNWIFVEESSLSEGGGWIFIW